MKPGPRIFRKRPVEVQACVIPPMVGHDAEREAIEAWLNGHNATTVIPIDVGYRIFTLEGDLLGEPGDMLVREPDGRFYSCRLDLFLLSHEEVE